MPFNRKPQKFNASIKEVTIGCGEKAVTLGGENVFPFYTFDGERSQGRCGNFRYGNSGSCRNQSILRRLHNDG